MTVVNWLSIDTLSPTVFNKAVCVVLPSPCNWPTFLYTGQSHWSPWPDTLASPTGAPDQGGVQLLIDSCGSFRYILGVQSDNVTLCYKHITIMARGPTNAL